MSTLAFIVPAHGRLAIAEVCFRQLRRTCDALAERSIIASAVVIADDENLDLARDNGFATVERDNQALGRKINDGYEFAGREGIDYMAPFGSDDWIDPAWITLPGPDEVIVTRLSTVVHDDRQSMSYLTIPFGDGVRIRPRQTLERVRFRPCEEDRNRAIDTSTHLGMKMVERIVWHDTSPLCIVDWKTSENLNDYGGCMEHFGRGEQVGDIWAKLAEVYPAEAIREMQALELVAA